MLPQARRDGVTARAVSAPSRCRGCGRRVAHADPGCPDHGPVTPAPGGAEQEPATGAEISDARLLRALEPPPFPGYRRVRLVGAGGFGAVFAAEPEGGGPAVAIKLARADRSDAGIRLVEEMKALSDIGPPHVPAVYTCGRTGSGSPYLVMEYLAAPTLAARLIAPGAARLMPPREASAIARAALRALEAVHARGYVHRDIKPENIVIAGSPVASGNTGDALRATILDLGLAAGHRERSLDVTADGAAPGTAEYMAPEQCDGRADVDARADIYAIGVILFELLTGRPPFWGPPAVVRQDHLSRRPPRLAPLAPVAPALEEVVLRCLSKNRDHRFGSAAALRTALEQLDSARTHREKLSTLPAADAPTPSSRAQERRAVALLYFEADLDLVTLERRLGSLGGELAHAAGNRFVAVFDHEDGASPMRRALHGARELEHQRIVSRGVLDLASVSVQTRPDGTRRFMSPLFSRAERFPARPDATLLMSPAAAAALHDGTTAALDETPQGLDPIPVPPEAELPSDASFEPLLGRSGLLDALVESARSAAASATPTITSVLGEAGHGKTRLASALCSRLRVLDERAEVIELRASEPGAGGADRTVRELLQRALALPASPPPDGGRALLRSRLGAAQSAKLGAAVALALGWIGDGAQATDAYPELAALSAAPGALRAALTVAAGEALRRRARLCPLFVVLDDAHAADDAALAALEYAALAEARLCLWICALGRPAFARARPGWGERAARRQTYDLGALDRESAAALCRRLLLPAEDLPEPALAHLVDRAQGVPLLLVELVRGLKREGIVRRHPLGGGFYLATDELDHLPDLPLLDWLALGEIDALPPALQAHARLVALLGPGVTVAEIAGVLHRLDEHGEAEGLPLDAAVATQRLVATGVLVQKRDGCVGFRHALVREAVARSTPEPLRRRIHLAAFRVHQDAAEGERPAAHARGTRLIAFACHAAQAGLGAVAEAAYLTLAERARARHAYLDAETFYSRALEQPFEPTSPGAHIERAGRDDAPGAPPDRAAAHRGRGLMRYRLGRYHDALADFAQARDMARARGDVPAQIEILLDEATALDWMEEFKSSEARVDEAGMLADRITVSPALAARLLLGIGRSLHRFSREEEAAVTLERAAAAAEPLGDEGYETRVIALLMLGFILQGLGRLDDAERALDRTIALCEAHHDTLHLCSVTNNRALLWACRGDKARMVADLTRVLSLARDLGHAWLELAGEFNLGECLYLMDDLGAAAVHIERAIAIEQRRHSDVRPVTLLLEARFRLYHGDEAEARALFQRIREGQVRAREGGRADALMVPSEEVLCAMIDLATRKVIHADDAAWDELVVRSAQSSVGQEHIEVLEMRAVAALRRGRPAAARRALDAALEAAARIPNVMGDRLRRLTIEITALETRAVDATAS
jgi:eukaryotic-like serine/threonine-protein kinase